MAVTNAVSAVSVDDVLLLLEPALYVAGEIHKVWDKTNRAGEVKFYARFLVDDEPGTIQVNISDLSPADIKFLARSERERALLRVRVFAIEGNAYYKAISLCRSLSGDSGSALASLLASDDEDGDA